MTTAANTNGVAYYVKNENTLGYIFDAQPTLFCVLASKPQHGGDDWRNGPRVIGSLDKVRRATASDFDYYRVQLPPDFKEADA